MIKSVGLLGLFVTLLPLTTQAANNDFYIGLSYGTTTIDTGITAVTASLDDEDSGFKIFLGKKINANLSVEGFYADFGEASLTGNNGDTFTLDGTTFQFIVNNASITAEATALGINGLYAIPLSDTFSFFGKAGLMFWDSEGTVSGAGVATASVNDDVDMLSIGIIRNF